ncbi:MAG: hypothetical protein OEZ54_12270 [Gemmatimonadota bacterium]|nr:hypothetical protein [Gemmatimonadota bacterium]
MSRLRLFSILVSVILVTAACGSRAPRPVFPPRLDLFQFGRVGLVKFVMEDAEGTLDEFATQRFAETVIDAQMGVEVLELGDQQEVLDQVGQSAMDRAALQAISGEYDTPAIFVGEIVVSNIQPRASLGIPPRLRAEVTVELVVRLYSGESGGTLWTRSAQATQTVAHLSLEGGRPSFGAQDPEEAYGELVDYLIYEITHDLRPSR